MSLENIKLNKLSNAVKKETTDDFLVRIASIYSKDEKKYKNIINFTFVNIDVIGPLKMKLLFNDEWYETSDNNYYYYYRKKKLYMD